MPQPDRLVIEFEIGVIESMRALDDEERPFVRAMLDTSLFTETAPRLGSWLRAAFDDGQAKLPQISTWSDGDVGGGLAASLGLLSVVQTPLMWGVANLLTSAFGRESALRLIRQHASECN